jgi:outer membrane protein
MRMNIRIPALAALLCATSLAGVPAYATDFAEVYARALQNDPLIREAEANRLAANEAKPQALAALLPQLSAGAGYDTREANGEAPFTGLNADGDIVSLVGKSDVDSDTSIWDVTLRQSIFRWENWVTLGRANREVAQAEVDYQAAQQDLILRTAERYFNVLAAKDTLTAAEATYEALGRQLEQAEKRFEVGLIAVTDVQEAKAAYDSATAALIQAKRNLATQQEFLRELTGDTFETLSKPGAKLPLVAPDPANEDDWVKLAMDQNLRLASSRLATEITRDDISFQRGGHYPSIDLVISRGNQDVSGDRKFSFEDPVTGGPVATISPLDSNTDDTTIGVQLTVPIYSGGATSSRVRQAEYRHRAARERLERTARETERDTRDAYLGVMSEMSRVQALEQAVESAKVALQATEAGYEVGTRTTVDVLDGRRRLFEAETNYARSRYDYLINVIRLKQAAGTLSPTQVANINKVLNETVTLR